MEIHDSFVDIHNSIYWYPELDLWISTNAIVGIQNSFMDLHNSSMDLHNFIMYLYNYLWLSTITFIDLHN